MQGFYCESRRGRCNSGSPLGSETRAQEDRDKEHQTPNRCEGDGQARVAGIGSDAPEKESGGHEQGGGDQKARSPRADLTSLLAVPTEERGEGKIDQPEERAVGVSQNPHMPTGGRGNREIPIGLQSVKQFEGQAHRQEEEKHPPSEVIVPRSQI